ncbi:hypothetical protein [Salinispira pacifica]|uniref:Uncharacterized protein n=1 Tax=Salinispira pacifica TaxID=1307761 RepID=V5WGJ9_9SPIO|nr:hypothetical protein [Salinispira pacifica]AHC14750.1 hypothetical protein L21SP2_1351 [Salinispira pacifica]
MKEGARLSTSMVISLLIHLVLISLWLIISAISPPEEPETLQVVLAPAAPPPAVDASDPENDTTRLPEAPESAVETPEAPPEAATESAPESAPDPAADPNPAENSRGTSTDSRSQPSGGSRPPETARADDAAGRTTPPTIPDDPDPLDWQVPRERDERSSTDLSGFLSDDEQSERDRQLEEWRNSNSAGDTGGSDSTPGRDTAPPRSDTGEDDPGERGPDPELAERLACIREETRSSDNSADSDRADGPSESPADDQTSDPDRDPGDSSAESLRRQGISGEILQQGRDLISEDRLDLGRYLDQSDVSWDSRIRIKFTVDSDGFVTILNPESYSAYNQLSRAIERLFTGPVFEPDPDAPPVRGSIVFQIR